ncbi:hypothetical protein HY449_01165 [Candidatus Pacearchaeota archaeon]|nr:hypothetical protein [Candidatus Pacearchaeota archaeon]
MSKTNKITALALFLLFLTPIIYALTYSTGNIVMTINYDNSAASSMTIKDTQSVAFNVYALAAGTGLTASVNLLYANNSLVKNIANVNVNTDTTNEFGLGSEGDYVLGKTEYANPGSYKIRLTASGNPDSSGTLDLLLTVVSNDIPLITSSPILSVNEGQYYSYQVVADDSDVADFGDVLTYSLTGNPSWLSIDSTGLIFGTAPLVTSNQSFSLTAGVSDGMDSTAQTYNLLVVDASAGDTNAPTIAITSPANGTIYNSIQTVLNYNANDAEGNLYQCWYSLDGGLTNSTETSCSGAFAGLVSTQGSNTWTVYASDTAGNEATDSVVFIVDSIAPNVSITSPTVGATVNGDEAITFTDSELTNAQCSVDNATWTNCTSGVTPISALAGFSAITNGNTFTLYVRDTDAAGNVGTASVALVKNISVDNAAPIVTIIFPTASGDYNSDDDVDEIRYTATDSNIQSCWYSLDGGLTNSTAVTCSGIFTGLDSRNGFNTWTVYARDSFGNVGSKSVTFFIDSDKDAAKIVYQDPDDQKYLQQTRGTPTTVSPVVDLTSNISGNIFARMLGAIVNFLKALFGFN